MIFDKQYYDDIWGTVHRHDYADNVSNFLIQKYGKCRILDVGTGCGEVVRLLREKGCNAWGLEISDYAIENSCCKEYVRKGDIRNIPFGNNSFDVIHTNGVWGYFPEEDVDKAWAECKRVGKFQQHNIDVSENTFYPNDKYVIWKSKDWWKDKFYPKILIACPTHEVKEYSMQRWIDNIKKFTYPNYDILVVDNSPTDDLLNRWKGKIPMERIADVSGDMSSRIGRSMEVIRKKFLSGNYYKWFNIEIDIIPPIDVVEKLISIGKDSDWISHAYANRGMGEAEVQQGIGCSMFSKKLMEHFGEKGLYYSGYSNSVDGWLWNIVRPLGIFTTIELWSFMKIKHLAE